MARSAILNPAQLLELQRLDTCTVSNAIEYFEVRLRNTGFMGDGIRCRFPDMPPMVGYAATARLRAAAAPVGGGIYHDRSDWWTSILAVPEPRIVVLEDRDDPPGVGAFVGDVHGAILRALGCVGYVTNGSVRELPRVRALGLHLYSTQIAVSHSYAHLFDLGVPVRVGGLEVHPGDLLHGDQHGVLSIPAEIAAEVPRVAAELRAREEALVRFCQTQPFSIEALRARLQLPDDRS